MIPDALAAAVREVRENFLSAIGLLEKSASFRALLIGSEKVAAQWKDISEIIASPRMQRAISAQFTCAFIGSSSHGKTSILAEMFPSLTERGWLVTDVSDTTSQALKIRPSKSRSDQDEVIVHSWDTQQIARLVRSAASENERLNIDVAYRSQCIEINGEEANFPADEKRRFRFALRQQLRPLPRSYRLTHAEAHDPGFIRALTVKETSDRARPDVVLSLDGESFHALQLRAAVKAVELCDPYSELLRWSGEHTADVGKIVFMDTPGLNVVGSVKDEVLRAVLGRKNQQIIVELLRNDDLDVIVHLVLAGQQSAFAQLWGPLRQECDAEDLADLADRVVLAVNGMNIYFTNDDLRRKWDPQVAQREGDPFSVTLESNIMERMSEAGRFMPARICFVDSKRIVEAAGRSYQQTYADYQPLLDKCLEPGAVGHDTLKRLGILGSFAENVRALCDPANRGQGFLVQQILDLVRTQGPSLFVRKHLVRSKLTRALKVARDLLARYYDDTGQMESAQAIEQVLTAFLPDVKADDLESIERYYKKHLEAEIDRLVPGDHRGMPPGEFVRYKISREGMAALRATGASEGFLAGIKGKIGKEFDSEEALVNELKAISGFERGDRVLALAIHHFKVCVWSSNAYLALCRLIYNTAIDRSVLHQLDDRSLTSLRNSGLPKAVLTKLIGLRGKRPLSRERFEQELTALLDTEESQLYTAAILKSTRQAAKDDERLRNIFQKHIQELMNRWRVDWGYRSADLPLPSPQQPMSADLLRHVLHFHAREILYQIVAGNGNVKAVVQDERDREQVKAALQALALAQRQADELCKQFGGPVR